MPTLVTDKTPANCCPKSTNQNSIAIFRIIIPYYNGLQDILSCLKSLKNNNIPQESIIIVDNNHKKTANTDILPYYPKVTIIETPPRIGYGKAANAGLDHAIKNNIDYICVINQDTILSHNCLAPMIDTMEKDLSLSICGPINLSDDLKTIEPFYIRHYISKYTNLIQDIFQGRLCKTYYVSNIIGSFLLFRTSAIIKLGLFDPIYFMYGEDDDLCRRYILAGHRIAICTNAFVGHKHSHTTSSQSPLSKHQPRASEKIYILKDPNSHFITNFYNFLRTSLIEYGSFFLGCKPMHLAYAIFYDSSILIQLPRILLARKNEMQLIRRYRNRTPPPPNQGAA